MKSLGLRIAAFALGVLLFISSALAADTYRVVRSVRLLSKPSSTSGQRIKTLHAPEVVTATGGKNGDYIRVQDESGDVGWVYAPYLTEAEPQPAEEFPAPANEVPPVSPTPGEFASSVSASWDKPAPQAATFHINGKTCGPTGTGEETETNLRKNRTDTPTSVHAVTFDAVDKLPYPVEATTKRSKWTPDQLAAIAPVEGVALTVTAYLVALKPQAGNSESCNCGMTGANETDWHMALVGQHGDQEKDALVVETTPRIRVNHPMWTTSNIAPWKGSTDPIRVSGWLMLDPEHKGHLHKYRNTLWEIHPITKIEVMKNGAWVDLDQLQSGPS